MDHRDDEVGTVTHGATTVVSVDLDDTPCYHAIHGLPPPDPSANALVLERCLPRFLELFERTNVRATFFVVGRDLERDLAHRGEGARLLQRALADGHELANHTHTHAYELVRWPIERIADDIRRCDAVLRSLGADPKGFRAPGYTHDRALLQLVAQLGYAYDSSALPSPAYYVAKLLALLAMRMHGRRSASLAWGARSFFGRASPSRPVGFGLWRVPVGVTPWLRLPFVGTALLSGPAWLSWWLRRAATRVRYLHLELHGLDLADPGVGSSSGDGFSPELVAIQPELGIPLELRAARLRAVLTARGGATTIASAIDSWSSRDVQPW